MAVLLVHGGAGAWPTELRPTALEGIRGALADGWAALENGSSLDAVEAAVAYMEDDPTFNAGRGSCLTSDGRVQMDALIMDGTTLNAGAVACVERLRNPVRAARLILDRSRHVLFAGPDAERMAVELGLELCDPGELITDRRQQEMLARGQDTVGAVALDHEGRLAAATSTGGMTGKAPGRVGDSPLVGCGGYANEAGAASTTGWGEAMIKLLLARWAVECVSNGDAPRQAARLAIQHLERRLNGTGGIIVVDHDGRYGAAANTAAMPWGVKTRARETVEVRPGRGSSAGTGERTGRGAAPSGG